MYTNNAVDSFLKLIQNVSPPKPPVVRKGPRGYQFQMAAEAIKLSRKEKIVCIESGCGTGKTVICALICDNFVSKGKVLVIGYRDLALGDLTQGNIKNYAEILDPKIQLGICNKEDSRNDVEFWTVSKFYSLLKNQPKYLANYLKEFSACICDEVHHLPDDGENSTNTIRCVNKSIKQCFNKKKVFTCTATHTRTDEQFPFGIEKPHIKRTINESILEGWTPDIYGIPVYTEVDGEVIKVGDSFKYAIDFNSVIQSTEKLIKNDKYGRHVFFCRTKDDCVDLCSKLNKEFGSGKFEILVSDTKDEDRIRIVKSIKNYNMLGYVTVNVGAEGIDVPNLKYCHLIRRTTSDIILSQSIGRVTRLWKDDKWEKNCAVVIDYMVMKSKVLDCCKGIWDYAVREGTTLSPEEAIVGGSLFTERNGTEPDEICKVTFGSMQEWITKEYLTSDRMKAIEELIRLAEGGSEKPIKTSNNERERYLGNLFMNLVHKQSICYNENFSSKISKIRPDWIGSHNPQNKKNVLLKMKSKPTGKLLIALHCYTMENNPCYDKNFHKQIQQLHSDWLVRQNYRQIAKDNKEQILKLKDKPFKKSYLGTWMYRYMSPASSAYDEIFTKKLKDEKSFWFNREVTNKRISQAHRRCAS